MKLIVGLGNPGPDYVDTRHNLGFDVVASFAQKFRFGLSRIKFESLFGEGEVAGERVLLAQPQTFMNLSGRSVASAMSFYKLDPSSDLCVVHDELDLPFGRVKVSRGGGPAGHRGVTSIQQVLKTQNFCRIRVGIGRPLPNQVVSDFVLERWKRSQKSALEDVLDRSVSALFIFVERGLEAAMQFCNVRD